MTAAELSRLAAEVGLDVVGAAPAEPYEATERHIRERKERGLFADLRFTMAWPEVLSPGAARGGSADGRVGGALLLRARAGTGGRTRGASRMAGRVLGAPEPADRARRALGGAHRVLVDANDHVDREAAVRAGVAFYGKNTMAITRRFGSWVVLGTLVTDVEIETAPRLELDCGSCRLCIDACPTGALDEPGVLDATKCLSYWTQAPKPIPRTIELGDSVYGCDICQDVCPWNRGVEKRRRGSSPPDEAMPVVSLLGWLERDGDELAAELDRLYVPRNDARWLRRNALVAAGNVGTAELVPAVERLAAGDDPMLQDAAVWALDRMSERVA